MIRALLVGVFLTLYVLLVAPWFVLHAALTRRIGPLYCAGVGGAKLAMRLAGIRVRVEGLENIPAGVCIFVANHTSNADPPAVVAAIPRRVALLAKKEVYRVPVLATALRLGGFVAVDRSNREAARASVEEALERMREGLSFAVFPEGTRSPDGRLRPFKKGSFLMGIRAGVPLVPVSVSGSQRVLPKGSWRIRPGEITVRFHPAVDAAAYSLEQRDELVARVERVVASGLPEQQQPKEQWPVRGDE
jgi:1-acyl-sn-glycerol-3-phosphate acyltransferase